MRRALLSALAAALVLPGGAAAADIPGPQHSFPIVREGASDLPDHTLIRPASPEQASFKLPVVVWGNGGCRDSNEEYHYFLTHFAAYGFFIVANGPPENAYHPEELQGIADPQPSKLIAAIDWAVKHAGDYRLDTSRIAVMGQSCGAWEGLDASADKRVISTVAWNNGGDPHAGDVAKLHAPVLYVRGGQNDYTSAETIQSYQRTTVPAILANLEPAGHTGLWDDPTPPTPPPGPYQDEPLLVGAQWLAFTLYGDAAARQFFLGDTCGLCKRPDWTVESKSWDRFVAPPPPPEPAPATTLAPSPAAPVAKPPCTSRRTVVLHLRRGERTATVTVDGQRVGRLRRGQALRLRFPGHGPGTVTVRIAGRDGRGRRTVDVRRYRLCG